MQGRFITFEGIDGTGKTTQINLVREYLRARAQDVFVTREPGGKGLAAAEAIRRIILNPRYRIDPRCEILLYEASRAQHVARSIRPRLRKGYWVLCDRFTDATLAYQGGGRHIPLRELQWLNRFATRDLTPDLTVLLDLPVGMALRKARKISRRGGGDRLENEKLGFHRRVYACYRRMERRCSRIRMVAVADRKAETHRRIIRVIESRWPTLTSIKCHVSSVKKRQQLKARHKGTLGTK